METPRATTSDTTMKMSTPSSSFVSYSRCLTHSSTRSQRSAMEILEEVSRLTLNEPPSSPQSSPVLSPFHTPTIRKRKPSTVTPPRPVVGSIIQHQLIDNARMSNFAVPSKATLPPPMLPTSPDFDDGSTPITMQGGGIGVNNNPFTRHRPLHSPFSGVSSLNLDFINATFKVEEHQEEQHQVEQKQQQQHDAFCPPLPTRQNQQLHPHHDAALALGDAFPDLEDDAVVPLRALKMRRRSPEFDPVLSDISI